MHLNSLNKSILGWWQPISTDITYPAIYFVLLLLKMVSDSLNPHQNPFIQSQKPAGGVSVIIQVWGQMGALWLSAALWLCSVTYNSTLALSSLWKLWKLLLVLWGSVSEWCVIVVSINIINGSVQCDLYQYCDLTDHRLMEYCHRLGPFRWAAQIWS